jgi:hypothetical protein
MYLAWCLLWLTIAASGVGEAGISAHIVLILTGVPSALFSLGVKPSGSMLAVAAAAALGFLQWVVVAHVLRVLRARGVLPEDGA